MVERNFKRVLLPLFRKRNQLGQPSVKSNTARLARFCIPIILMMISWKQSVAQCTIPTVTNVSTVAATCPGNGVIDVDASPVSGLTYSILSGPTTVSGSVSDGVFNSLNAGTYVVRVYNAEGAGCYVDTSITVANTYTPFSFSLAVTNLCAGTTAGTINVNTTAGSAVPLEVAYWQGAAGALDTGLSFGSTFSYSVPEDSFGIWNVRVKDVCGEAVTQQITLSNPYPANLEISSVDLFGGTYTYCGDDTITFRTNLSAGTAYSITSLPAAGVTVDVYEKTSSSCVPVPADYVLSYTILPTGSTSNHVALKKGKNYIFVLNTPCGGTDTFCYSNAASQLPSGAVFASQKSCDTAAGSAPLIDMFINIYGWMIDPVTYVAVSGTDTLTGSFSSNIYTAPGFDYDKTYTVYLIDACNDTLTKTITMPSLSTPLTVGSLSTSLLPCTNISGKVTVSVILYGAFPGLANDSTTVVIASGPDAGSVGVRSTADSRQFYFYNLTPGAVNTIKLTNTCGEDAYVPFTVPAAATPLNQNVTISATQLCDVVGKGNLSIQSTYNGGYTSTTKVYKVGTATPLLSSSGSILSLANQAPGYYYAVMELVNSCGTYTLSSDTVQILAAGVPPVIKRKATMICESPYGSPTEGMLSLEVIGAAPFVIEYKKVTASTWTVYSTNSDGTELINGMEIDSTYNIRITDNCGSIVTDFFTVGSLETINMNNTAQPCVGAPYTLSVPSFVNATYAWSKDGISLGVTAKSFTIPTFTDVHTGTYVCTITIGGCLVRSATLSLYSQFCDSVITDLSLSGNVYQDGNGLSDGMVNGTPTNAGGQLYANLTDSAGLVLASVPVNADGTYVFNNVPMGTYKVILSDERQNGGSTLATSILPVGWGSTGEHIAPPTTMGDDGVVNGISATFTLSASNIDNINFAIEQAPESYDESQTITGAPVVGINYALTEALSGSDLEDNGNVEVVWNINPITITALPTNGFDLIYDGVILQLGDTIVNYDPSKLFISPTLATPGGTFETQFEFASIDSAGMVDPSPAVYVVTFTTPLPVELLGFSAYEQHCTAVLTWAVGREDAIREYGIEHSADGRNYVAVGLVPTKGSWSTYHDTIPVDYGRNYYRLKIRSFDGSVDYTDPVILSSQCKDQKILTYPNPVAKMLYVDGVQKGSIIKIADVQGKIVHMAVVDDNSAVKTISMQDLSPGTYWVLIQVGDAIIYQSMVVKQ